MTFDWNALPPRLNANKTKEKGKERNLLSSTQQNAPYLLHQNDGQSERVKIISSPIQIRWLKRLAW